MTTLVLLRHAPTAYNASGRLQGSLDIPLADAGRLAADAAAGALVRRYGAGLRVVSSPLARARDTAAAVARAAGVELALEDALTQRRYGVWEGLTWDEIERRWPEQYMVRRDGGEPEIDGWESTAAVAERVGAGLRAHAGDGVTVAVSHGSAIGGGIHDLLGISPDLRVLGRLAHAHWVELEGRPDGTWRLAGYGLGED